MSACERKDNCPFFDRRVMGPSMKEVFNESYCNGYFTRCARYVVFKVCGSVPPDLSPSMHNRATELCGERIGPPGDMNPPKE